MGAPVFASYTPMGPTQVREPFHREGWVYEEKVDDWRMLAYKDGVLPKLSQVAVLLDPSDTVATSELRAIQAAARTMGVVIKRFDVLDRIEPDTFAAIRMAGADALIVAYTIRTALQRERIVAFAAANRLPLVSESREFSDAGALMTYGPNSARL